VISEIGLQRLRIFVFFITAFYSRSVFALSCRTTWQHFHWRHSTSCIFVTHSRLYMYVACGPTASGVLLRGVRCCDDFVSRLSQSVATRRRYVDHNNRSDGGDRLWQQRCGSNEANRTMIDECELRQTHVNTLIRERRCEGDCVGRTGYSVLSEWWFHTCL